jgi:NitT/TauT family transport system substrate-binding protein
MKSYLRRNAAAAVFLAIGLGEASAKQKIDQTTFGTNWVAQAEHGGFYQAVADGTYKKYNLEVKIVPGGPQSNNRMMLPVGRLDFYMGGNMIQAFSAVQENIPTLVVAAIF